MIGYVEPRAWWRLTLAALHWPQHARDELATWCAQHGSAELHAVAWAIANDVQLVDQRAAAGPA